MADRLGLEICGLVFFGILIFTSITVNDASIWKEARLIADINWEKKIFTENEKEMAVILLGQMKLGNTEFTCDIDVISRLHDDIICLSKLDVITPTKLGYLLHGETSSGHMWFDSDGELVKLKGMNGKSEVEYNGTVNKIVIKGHDYYLITNAIMQGNH